MTALTSPPIRKPSVVIGRFGATELTFIDFFCGAGGASTGLVEAGWTGVHAANHWARAIETHNTNHPDIHHICANINDLAMRTLRRCTLLWASVICTEASPAGGKRRTGKSKKVAQGQDELPLEEFGAISPDGFVNTRATAHDVYRYAEVHRPTYVVVENVPEFTTDWGGFAWWRQGIEMLGYTSRIVSVNSAHVGNDSNAAAPQWRNRIYIVFVAVGAPIPDLEPRPLSRCDRCSKDVAGVQTWKNGNVVGAYREQYVYTCPDCASECEPYIRPAGQIIDWKHLGPRIGDRPWKEFFKGKKGDPNRQSLGFGHVAPSTYRKIRIGLDTIVAPVPRLVTVTHGADDDGRVKPVWAVPLPTRTAKIGEAVVVPPGAFITELRGGGSAARHIEQPLGTVTGNGYHHGIITPPAGMVIPYRKNCIPRDAHGHPLPTVSTRDSAGLLTGYEVLGDIAVEDCTYRMITPREQMLAQRFPGTYVMTGNGGEQTLQAGNAVSVNVARWIGEQVAAALS